MHYDEQIAALRRVFRPMGPKAATLLNFLRVAEAPVARLAMAEKMFPGKGLSTVDNLMCTGVRPYLTRIGIVVRNEMGKGWYLLPIDQARITKMMEALPPPTEENAPGLTSDTSERLQRFTVYLRKEDLGYYAVSARIRDVSTSSLLRRLFRTIADDKMVEAILDDADDLTQRVKGDHSYKHAE